MVSGQAGSIRSINKFEGNAPEYISRELRDCAAITSKLDAENAVTE